MTHATLAGFITLMWLVTSVHAAGDPEAPRIPTPGPTAAVKQAPQSASGVVPAAAQSIINRAELCEHFAGEFNGNRSERDREVTHALTRYKCDRVAGEVRGLRLKYKNNPVVMEQLKRFE